MAPEFWDLIKSYGPAALPLAMCLWWGFNERSDRKEAEKELKHLYRSVMASSQQRAIVDQVGNQVAAEMAKALQAATAKQEAA